MKILVTGAKGFVGRNLCESIKSIRDGKDRRPQFQPLLPIELFEYDLDTPVEMLDEWCREADFVFNLAGANRPPVEAEFMSTNRDFAEQLLGSLESAGNTCPVMLSSSIQASLEGRFAGSPYGESKLAGEQLFWSYAERTGARVLVYRFPNIFGKWCRPNYNSAVATFCNNIANGLPITVNDESVVLDLLYIDDLVAELLRALIGEEARGSDGFCYAAPVHHESLGTIVSLLESFREQRHALAVPRLSPGSFEKKLYSTFLSYMPAEGLVTTPHVNSDERGSFTELFRSSDCGQIAVNISKPGAIKGQHWHHSKIERFCVISGTGRVQLRKLGVDENGQAHPVTTFDVCGDTPQIVEMAPGFTHNLINLSPDEDMITIIWCNELFDPSNPDTFGEVV